MNLIIFILSIIWNIKSHICEVLNSKRIHYKIKHYNHAAKMNIQYNSL